MRLLFVPAVLVLGLAALACGDDNKSSSSSSAQPTSAPAATATPAAAAPVAVALVDNAFQPAALTAKAGQKLTLNLSDTGQRPHTFTIDGIVDSGRLDAGSSKTIDFTIAQAGAYTFYCTVHGKANMFGTLTVAGPNASTEPGSSDSASGTSAGGADGY